MEIARRGKGPPLTDPAAPDRSPKRFRQSVAGRRHQRRQWPPGAIGIGQRGEERNPIVDIAIGKSDAAQAALAVRMDLLERNRKKLA